MVVSRDLGCQRMTARRYIGTSLLAGVATDDFLGTSPETGCDVPGWSAEDS